MLSSQLETSALVYRRGGIKTSLSCESYKEDDHKRKRKRTIEQFYALWKTVMNVVESILHDSPIHQLWNYQIINWQRAILAGLKIAIRFVQLSTMKNLFYTLRHKADFILQNNTATKGRPLGFQIAVATIFAIDVAFITFCVIKIVTQ